MRGTPHLLRNSKVGTQIDMILASSSRGRIAYYLNMLISTWFRSPSG